MRMLPRTCPGVETRGSLGAPETRTTTSCELRMGKATGDSQTPCDARTPGGWQNLVLLRAVRPPASQDARRCADSKLPRLVPPCQGGLRFTPREWVGAGSSLSPPGAEGELRGPRSRQAAGHLGPFSGLRFCL